MGWTYTNAWHFTKRGKVNIKAELDQCYFARQGYEILKSAVVQGVYYAAVRKNGESEVFGVAFLTDTKPLDGWSFGYKEETENMGPVSKACPVSILRLLSPTTNKYALAWRDACAMHHASRRKTAKLNH